MADLLTTLTPVFGFNPDGSFKIAPLPAVLQFPGVPALIGGFGNQIGIRGGGVDVNASAGQGLPFSGLSGGLAQGINTAAAGVGGPLAGGVSPFGQSLGASLTPAMTQDTPGALFQDNYWGIFDTDMHRIAAWDSVIKIDYRHEMKIADFPIERGAFASYNKVQVPFDIRISFAIGGARGGAGGGNGSGVAAREQFLSQIEKAVQSLNMYIVCTPEAIYPQANLTHMEYSRESRRGLNLLVVEVWVQEVRLPEGAAFTDMNAGRSATYLPGVNTGGQQAKPIEVHLTPDPANMPGRGTTTAVDTPPANTPVSSATGNPAAGIQVPGPLSWADAQPRGLSIF